MFCCSVRKTGEIANTWTYRGTPESLLLEQELVRRLDTAVFVPAIYNRQPVHVLFYGTVTFKIVNGKPRLRIFANQEAEELKKESDFVGPQPFVGRDSKFEGLHYPHDDALTNVLSGLVEMAMKIDANGNLKELKRCFGGPAPGRVPASRLGGFPGGEIHSRLSRRETGRVQHYAARLLRTVRRESLARVREAVCRGENKKPDPAVVLFPARSARLRARAGGHRAGLGEMLGHRRRDRGLSHARRTKPATPLRGRAPARSSSGTRPGAIYIYMNYGVHWMLNVLVKGGARSGLILIRALEPRRGLSLMRARRGVEDVHRLCSGPGKLAQALDITKRHHEMNLCTDPRYCFLREEDLDAPVVADPRIGISRATDLPWRFTLAGSPFVSVPVRPPNARKRLTAGRTARTFTAR